MPPELIVAAIQMCSGESLAENLATAERLVGLAFAQGAELVVLPELFACYGRAAAIVASAEAIPGPTSQRMAEWATKWQLCLCGGSIAERTRRADKVYNTSIFFHRDQGQVAAYRKMHLFDADVGPEGATTSVRESGHLVAGNEPRAVEALGAHVGMAICYDLRFPELFRGLPMSGMDILTLPAAFTRATGAAHWEVLLRARAIENQCFVIAANQCGEHPGGLTSYGHSMIVSPWGEVLAKLGDEREGIAVATLKLGDLQAIRGRLPALKHRRM